MVALSKPNSRVRGIVVGDLLQRLVARSFAQQHLAFTLYESLCTLPIWFFALRLARCSHVARTAAQGLAGFFRIP